MLASWRLLRPGPAFPSGKRNPRRGECGQGMVEFALVLPLLLLLVFGIIELGRLMVIFSSVSAASREAARYASAAGRASGGMPYYLDTSGIAAAANRVAVLAAPQSVTIAYDRGPGSATFTPASQHDVHLGDRVIITVVAQYNPILGLTPLQPFPITSTTSRTIVKEVAIEPGTGGGGGGGGGGSQPPTVEITAPDNGDVFNVGDEVTFECTGTDPDGGSVSLEWISSVDGQFGSGGSVTRSDLTGGQHVITCRGVDTGGQEATDSITITINPPPEVFIITPNSGIEVEEGTTLTFSGTATDIPDGDLSANLIWLDNGVQFGTGAAFDYSALSIGFHTITAQVTDSNGLTGVSAPVTLAVVTRTPPVVTIIAPVTNSYYALNTTVVFQGQAVDGKDGDLSAAIVWTSNLEGNLGTGASLSINHLGVGVHTITATATDSDGLSGTATIVIRIVDDEPPVVEIITPVNAAHYNNGQTIAYTGTADDATDGDLTDDLEWISSVDGVIGHGGSFSYSTLTIGIHTITARVTDSDGLVGSDQVVIYIDLINTPPRVQITAPNNGNPFSERERRSITFSGIATDDQDGNISNLIQWVSNLGGNLGSGASISTSTLIVGTHTITATVTDFGGMSAFDTTTVTIRPAICPSSGQVIIGGNPSWADKVTWFLTIPSGTTQIDQFILTSLSIDLYTNPSGARLSTMTVEGGNITYSTSGTISSATLNPVWTGFFREPSYLIEVIFNFDPRVRRDRGSTFFMRANFDGCPTGLQAEARP